MRGFRFALWALLAGSAAATAGTLVVGEPPPDVTFDGKNGERASGGTWSSDELRRKAYVLFYVDPDERELNEHVGKALEKEDLPGERFGTVAVINLKATWMPGWVLGRLLASKQKQYPRTLYLKDKDKVMVRAWGLADNGYDIVLFDHEGRVRFHGSGRLSEKDLQTFLEAVRRAVRDVEADAP